MRLSIRTQLGSLLLLSSLIGLAVISVAVWVTVHDFVLKLRAARLSQTASLKAAQLASNLNVMQTSVSFIASRVILQGALMRYNDERNDTAENWTASQSDLNAAIGGTSSQGQALLLQARVYGRDLSGPEAEYGLLNATATSARKIALPVPPLANGKQVMLGTAGSEYAFPPWLYPNLTYSSGPSPSGVDTAQATYDGVTFQARTNRATLLLGPWTINDDLALVSLTVPIVNNTNEVDTLGWLTCVMNATLISTVLDDQQGLGSSGDTLILGPATSTNFFPQTVVQNANDEPQFEVRYILPLSDSFQSRHPAHVRGAPNAAFDASNYPVIYKALARANMNTSDTSGVSLKAKNEAKQPLSVGYAMTNSDIVDWIVLVEQSRKEVWQPINQLRNVIIACVFGTAGLMAVFVFPLAHFASLPIVRLREATSRSIEPPGSSQGLSRSSFGSANSLRHGSYSGDGQVEQFEEADAVEARKEGFAGPVSIVNPLTKWKRKREAESQVRREERQRRAFRIPGKVKERRRCFIKDELSDLTTTFNEMSDELMTQYSRLEERVRQRTAELELSKQAAEAANESKTLFIANISHELKTPLNGILGMCAVCMQEDDPIRLKRSLGIIYKSGDLLLNLLTDLLTFSKNQVGQQLSLDEKEFRLRDISSQTLAIFEKQATEGQIDLRVNFEGIPHDSDSTAQLRPALGPASTGKLRDMILWGDVHRILQVVINLVSNSLKFTPEGGSVTLTIRCLSEEAPDVNSRRSSFSSKVSKPRPLRTRQRVSDSSSIARLGTVNVIDPKEKPNALTSVSTYELHASPQNATYIWFEFVVVDTGPGIAEHQLDKIFEPFVQGDLGLSKKYGGTGLGLSICSQLATLMKGTMSVESTVGSGSTFKLKIPLRHVQSRADSSASSAILPPDSGSRPPSLDEADRHGLVNHAEGTRTPPDGHPPSKAAVGGRLGNDSQPRLVGFSQPFFATSQPMESSDSQHGAMQQMADEAARGDRIRVLVAEDNKINQEVVLRMLKLEDIYDVTVAKDGQEALDLVKESMSGDASRQFNLIFMDVQMPNVDGIQSTKLIREIGYQAPIVALTAFAEESNIKDCLDSGMNYFLSKPIRRPQLKKVLKEYCAPIPEEPEDVTPPAERRGSGVNTTIVMVNNQGTAASADQTPSAQQSASYANSGATTVKDDLRSVSPMDVS